MRTRTNQKKVKFLEAKFSIIIVKNIFFTKIFDLVHMISEDIILGLFFADENNIVYENIKISEDLSESAINEIKMLPFKYLGPIFLTSAGSKSGDWSIEFIESSISLRKITPDRSKYSNKIQSFFNLNSSVNTKDGSTNLFAVIGSPYTENVKEIHDRMKKYIHPSILQGRIVSEYLNKKDFKFSKFIQKELERGSNLLKYSLGSSRKIYWEGQQKFYCVGLLERRYSFKDGLKNTFLYTFNENSPLKEIILTEIPSYYVLSILPDYYEDQIRETLILFGKKNIFPNIREIILANKDSNVSNGNKAKKVIYLEEFKENKDYKISYGAILIPDTVNKDLGNFNTIAYYRKNLRLILDTNKEFNEILTKINPHFINKKWGTKNNEDLNKIRELLDS